jgi:hypothetical protein
VLVVADVLPGPPQRRRFRLGRPGGLDGLRRRGRLRRRHGEQLVLGEVGKRGDADAEQPDPGGGVDRGEQPLGEPGDQQRVVGGLIAGQ